MEEDFVLTKDQEEKIEELTNQAEMFSMDVDWGALELIPKDTKPNFWSDYNDAKDNDPASPEQAYA